MVHYFFIISPFGYPLYKMLVFFTIISAMAWALLEYMFKFQSALIYQGKELADFLGYFSGIVNFAGIVVGFLTIKPLLKLFRIDGLFAITQLSSIAACILVLLYPSLWTVGLLFSLKTIFYQNHLAVASDLILSILPSPVRVTGKFHLKSTIDPAFSIVAYLLLFFFGENLSVNGKSFIALALFCMGTFFAIKTIQRYKKSLRSESEFKRFNFIDAFSSTQSSLLEPMAYRALESKDSEMILFGLTMLNKLERKPILPITVYEQLNNREVLVRKAAIQLIKTSQDIGAVDLLQKRISVERDSEVKLYLLDALATLHRPAAVAFANEHLKDTTPDLHAAVLHILLNYSELNSFQQKEYEKELQSLILHKNHQVSEVAIHIAATSHLLHLVPAILQKLTQDRDLTISVRMALLRMGPLTIPYILEELSKNEYSYLFIKLLAALPGEAAEEALLHLYHSADPLQSTLLARAMNRRACKERIGEGMKEAALPAIDREREQLLYLHYLLSKHTGNQPIIREIESRIHLAKERVLYWLGIATNPVSINKVMPSLLKPVTNALEKQWQGKALELLEIEVKDHRLRNRVLTLLEANKGEEIQGNLADPWLTRVIAAQTNPLKRDAMDILVKVFELRQIALFKQLAGETLLAIAEEARVATFDEGEVIFKEGDMPDGLYCICLGKVKIMRQGQILSNLGVHEFFGELSLLDEAPRTASALAESDCSLLILDKSTFDRLTDDIPEILRGVTRMMTQYLRQNFDLSSET